MKKTVTLFLQVVLLLFATEANAQTPNQYPFGDLDIKAKFDQVYNDIYANNSQYAWTAAGLYDSDPAVSIQHQNNLGSQRSGVLSALLVMYEATRCIDYLDKFMYLAKDILAARADKVSPQQSSAPYWFKDQVSWHGRILNPLSRFVYIVNSTPSLVTHPINSANFPGNSTMGDYAVEVNKNNIEVMDFILDGTIGSGGISNHFWDYDEYVCIGKPVPPANSGAEIFQAPYDTQGLNQQVPYGCALINMYLTNWSTRTDYGVKAVQMAQAHLISGLYPSFPNVFTGIYWYDAAEESYSWGARGWGGENPAYFVPPTPEQYRTEDIAHGGVSMEFPLLYNKHQAIFSSITSGLYFEDYQLARFNNTFSRKIYNHASHATINTEHDNGTAFNSNVYGGNCCYYHFYQANTGQNAPWTQELLQPNALSWIPLYKFDNINNSHAEDVYDILMNYYEYKAQYLPSSSYWGFKIKSLADMCAANYEREGIEGVDCEVDPDHPPVKDVKERISVYPNPSKEKMKFVMTESNVKIERIELRQVGNPNIGKDIQLDSQTKEVEIDLEGLPSGHYIALIIDEEGGVYRKLILKQ